MASEKDTIYVDIDDEITAIIDKVTSAKGKIVALVLPKRATAMQSLVNMKLLKRAADEANKNLVLVTSESGLMPLAGAAGLHVAATPTSKPSVPALGDSDDLVENIDEPEEVADGEAFDARSAENKPIGEVAGLAGGTAMAGAASDEEPIELDNSELSPIASAGKKLKKAKNKKLKVPNFKKFRLGVVIAVLALICLGIFFYCALEVWPHATVKIFTSQQQLPVSLTAKLSSSANTVDPASSTVPATPATQSKSYSQTVPASGQKDEGTPASGSIVMSICTNNPAAVQDVPAGTGVSTNNLTYITQNDASFSYAGGGGSCFRFQSNSVNIVAQNPGSNYNVSNATFSVSGSSATGSGSASGGTSNIVRVVQQSDIDSAKQQLANQDTSAIKQTLQQQLQQSHLMVLPQTFTALPSDVNSSANAGDQADNVTVTENVNYVMFGVSQNNLEKLIEANVKQQLSPNQGVLDSGLSSASFSLVGTPTTSSATVKINTTAIIGPKLDVANLKKNIEGKRAGDIRSELSNQNGVSKVEVDFSPFWVGSAPKDPNKITIDFIKSNG